MAHWKSCEPIRWPEHHALMEVSLSLFPSLPLNDSSLFAFHSLYPSLSLSHTAQTGPPWRSCPGPAPHPTHFRESQLPGLPQHWVYPPPSTCRHLPGPTLTCVGIESSMGVGEGGRPAPGGVGQTAAGCFVRNDHTGLLIRKPLAGKVSEGSFLHLLYSVQGTARCRHSGNVYRVSSWVVNEFHCYWDSGEGIKAS